MRVLLTGATGLIGQSVGRELARRGHQLVVLARGQIENVRRTLPFPAEIFNWSHEEAVPLEALHQVDAVVHLAGEPVAEGNWTDAKKQRIRDTRILGTRALVNAISQSGGSVKCFVLGSAVGYYGDAGEAECHEGSPSGEDFLAQVCRDWEAELAPLRCRKVAVRTGVVLSSRGGALAKMLPIYREGLGGRLGDGQSFFPWIHWRDEVGLLVWSLENASVDGVINAVAPTPTRQIEFHNELCRALDVRSGPPVPRFALKMAWGEMASVILASQRVVPRRAQELGYQFQFSSLSAALQDLLHDLRGRTYEMFAEQWLPQAPEEIFPFFCDEKNLETLTPPFLNFSVIGKSTPEIGQGTLIDYRLSLHGLPLKWRTRIEEWAPGVKFVDTQLRGPYSLWHHTHEFEPLAGGTLMRDRVLYRLPLGFMGDWGGGWKVARDVRQIFAYRRKKVDELMGSR
ncbi:MAG TPA: TIGR01777 family oxidoreductase [Pseudobdellovibrionaceae bacterium]|nr:TIGR01777 family oxidoreductase [Pseudobdellovibrionaceae bacterium]